MMPDAPATFEVLEVDQWTSTGNIKTMPWDTLKAQGQDAVAGGDSEAVRAISGGTFHFRTVRPEDHPSIARVWYIKGPDGFPQMYRYDYDSSD